MFIKRLCERANLLKENCILEAFQNFSNGLVYSKTFLMNCSKEIKKRKRVVNNKNIPLESITARISSILLAAKIHFITLNRIYDHKFYFWYSIVLSNFWLKHVYMRVIFTSFNHTNFVHRE